MSVKVTILGAGSGASAAAVDLSIRGFDVTLCSSYPADIKGRILSSSRRGGVEYSGVLGEGSLALKTSTDEYAVASADVVMIVTLAQGYAYYAERCSRLFRKDQLVFLNPAYLGGSLSFARTVRSKGGERIRLCEFNNLPYICRLIAPVHVRIFQKSRLILFSSFPSDENEGNLQIIKELYPAITPVDSILETGMMNPNMVVHPAGMILNAGWIEASQGNFRFYNEGCTSSVSRMIEAVDEERMRICNALGVKTMSIGEYYIQNGYSNSMSKRIHEVLLASEPNRNLQAPSTLDHRYITEDVPYGLVPLSCLGKIAKMASTTIDSLILLASRMIKRDFFNEGLTSEKMGISEMNVAQLRQYLHDGIPIHRS
jgi:opine dehydrogenase